MPGTNKELREASKESKAMKNMHLHIPDYMWKQIQEMDLPCNTVTSKILILMEKGINYYVKANKKAAKRANQGSHDQENDSTEIEKTIEIARTRWVD